MSRFSSKADGTATQTVTYSKKNEQREKFFRCMGVCSASELVCQVKTEPEFTYVTVHI